MVCKYSKPTVIILTFSYITNNLLMLLLVLSLMLTCYLLTHADLHDGGALVSLLTLALEVAGSVPANTVSAHSVHDAALVNICKHRRNSVDLSIIFLPVCTTNLLILILIVTCDMKRQSTKPDMY